MGFREPTVSETAASREAAEVSTDIEVISNLVRAGGEAIRGISKVLKENAALQLTDLLLLDELHRAGRDGVRTSKLAISLGMTTSRLAYRLNSLEKAGLIERRPHAEDGRGVIVTITDAGSNEHARGLELLAEMRDRSGGVFGDIRNAAASAAHAILVGGEQRKEDAEPTAGVVSGFAQICLERLSTEESAEGMFKYLAHEATHVLPIEWAMLLVPTEEGLLVTATFQTDRWPTMTAGGMLPYESTSPSTDTFRTGEPTLVSALDDPNDRYPVIASLYRSLDLDIRFHFAVPILGPDSTLGVLSATGLRPLSFDEGRRSILDVFARTLALRLGSERSEVSDHAVGNSSLPPSLRRLAPTDRALASGVMWGVSPKEALQHLGIPIEQSAAAMERIAAALDVDSAAAAEKRLREIARPGGGASA